MLVPTYNFTCAVILSALTISGAVYASQELPRGLELKEIENNRQENLHDNDHIQPCGCRVNYKSLYPHLYFGPHLPIYDIMWGDRATHTPGNADKRMVDATFSNCLTGICNALDDSAHINVPDTFNGYTPLHLAVLGESPHIVRFLIKAKANVNSVDKNQCTPLSLAISWLRNMKNRMIITQLLVLAGANTNWKKYNHGLTIHEIAATMPVDPVCPDGVTMGDIIGLTLQAMNKPNFDRETAINRLFDPTQYNNILAQLE